MVKHEGRDVGHTRKQQRLEQTEEGKDEPLEDQPGENCSNLFEQGRQSWGLGDRLIN